MSSAPHLRGQGDQELPASLPQRFIKSRVIFPALGILALVGFFWPARELHSDRERLAGVIRRGMTRDFSWQRAASAYEQLYQDTI